MLRVGTNAFPTGPTGYASAFNIPWFGAMFDSLVNFDEKYDIKPGVATKWELLPDNSAWRFTIRDDLTFSNGDKLTAEDVAFTVNQALKDKTPHAALNPFLTGAKVVGTNQVDLTISQRDVSTLFNGPGWLIWPEKYYEQVGKEQFTVKPIGSGPYVLDTFKTQDRLVYKLRQGYTHPYRKPILSEIDVIAVPEPTALVNGLRTGELDMVDGGSLSPEIATGAKNAGMQLDVKQASYTAILFNQKGIQGTPLADIRVRQAMNYAVDKASIAKNLYAGFATPVGQFGAPGTPQFDESIKPIPFDIAKAKQLLAEAGYPNGFTIPGGVQFINRPDQAALYQAIQSFHKEAGISYDLSPVELGAYIDAAYGRKERPLLFDAGSSNTNGVFTFTWGFLKCDTASVWYCVKGLDDNMKLALAETDMAKRNKHLQAAGKAWADEYPMVFLLSTPRFVLRTQKVKDFQWTTPTYYHLDSIYMAK